MTRFFLLFLFAMALAACLQPSSPTPSATPTPATPAATVYLPSTIATPTSTPSSTATPIPTPALVANASIPSLSDATLRLAPIINDLFNVSRVERRKDTVFDEVDRDVWVVGASEASYVYTLTLSHARTHWRPEELLETVQNASGTRNGYLSYSVGDTDKANVMKCHGQRYELNLNLKAYSRTWFNEDYQPLVRRMMSRLIDACPP